MDECPVNSFQTAQIAVYTHTPFPPRPHKLSNSAMLPGREAMSMPLTTAPRPRCLAVNPRVSGRVNGPASLFPPVLRFLGPWSKECELSECRGAGAYSVMRASHFPPIGWGRVGLFGKTDTTLQNRARGLAPSSVISSVSRIDLRVNALTRRLRWIIGRAAGICSADPQATVDQCIVSADA